jgi:hypothetical protein
MAEMSDLLIPHGAGVPEILITPLGNAEVSLGDLVSNQLKEIAYNDQAQILMPRLGLDPEALSEVSDQEISDDSASGYSTPELRDESGGSSETESLDDEAATLLTAPVGIPRQANTPSCITSLPTELHYMIFSELDAIDSTCLGLTNSHFYSMQQSLHGKVPLNMRRKGPNPLERAWKGNCRHCGAHRCQLYRHLKDWMPTDYEYCAIRQVYGCEAEEGAERYCYRSNPSKPEFCGRHREMRA